jgi:hypothetical protein
MPIFIALLGLLSQIEATDPGTGLLMTDRILYKGASVAAGMDRAAALRQLGPMKVIMKPRHVSAAWLLHDLETATSIARHVDMEIAMRSVRTGQPIPKPDETFERLGPAWTRLVAAPCGGVCSIELLEMPLDKGEKLRLVLVNGAVAAVTLDKSHNAYRRDLYKPWTGRRIVYQGDAAVLVTQAAGSLQVADLDLATGRPK